jgi:hypothetical protein
MSADKFPGGMVHKLLTFFSFLVLAMCAWKFFGPGSSAARVSGTRFLGGNILRRIQQDVLRKHRGRLLRLSALAVHDVHLLA